MGKTNSLNDEDLAEFIELQSSFSLSEKSWFLEVKEIDQESFDLSVKNPNKAEDSPLREPQEILEEIAVLDGETTEILASISQLTGGS
jgi:type I restriction enzyme M protein